MLDDADSVVVNSDVLSEESRRASECLSQARLLCVDIRNNGRFLDQRAIDADDFFARTSNKYMPLVMQCQKCRDRLSAIGFIKLANADRLQPIHFSDWTAITAHETACYLLQDVLMQYDLITGWDERGTLRGSPVTESEKRADCQRLVKWATAVSDEFINGIQAQIDIEYLAAHRWLTDRQTADETSTKILAEDKAVGNKWWHEPTEPRPKEYQHGPITGQKKAICNWMGEKDGPNMRRLNQKANKTVWVIRHSETSWEVWFKDERTYQSVDNNRRFGLKSG
jgi:hypothetical protein